MSDYRISLGTSGEFDLRVDVILLDDDAEDIDSVYQTDTIDDAVAWIERNGGTLVRSECPRCGHVQDDIWNRCEVCGNPAMVGHNPKNLSDRISELTALRAKVSNSMTHLSGVADPDVEAGLSLVLGTNTTGASTDGITALRLLGMRLGQWDLTIDTRCDFAGRGQVRITSSGGFKLEADSPVCALAILDVLLQAMIAELSNASHS